MTAKVIPFPVRQGPRLSPLRRSRNKPATVERLEPPNALERAMQLYLKASEIDVDDPVAGGMLYAKALLLNPEFTLALTNLGLCKFRVGDEKGAESCWLEAAERDEPCAFYNLGFLRTQDGRLDEAIALYRRAIQLDASYPDSHLNLGMNLSRIGKKREAKEAFTSYLALNPNDAVWSEIARKKLAEL